MITLSVSFFAVESVMVLLSSLPPPAASHRLDADTMASEKPEALSLAEAEAYIGRQLHDAMAQTKLRNSAQRQMNASSGPAEENVMHKPIMEIDFCVQVDIDMSLQVPGLTLNLGLLGAIEYNFKNDCWGTKLEASVGATFGVKFWGYQLKFSVSWTGFLHTHELPINDVVKMASTSQLIKDFANELNASGMDKMQCSTPDPFTVVLTALRHYIQRAVGEDSFEDELRRNAEQKMLSDERFSIEQAAYRKLGASQPNEGDFAHAIWYHADAMPLYKSIIQGIKQGASFWELLVMAPYLEEPLKKTPKLDSGKKRRSSHLKVKA